MSTAFIIAMTIAGIVCFAKLVRWLAILESGYTEEGE